MYITQEELVNKIAEKTRYTPNTVKDILRGLSESIQELLVVKPKENLLIDLWEGFKVKRVYENKKELSGVLKDTKTSNRVKIKCAVSRNLKEKINKRIFK